MGRKKKEKKPGSQIVLRLRDNEPDHIVDWFNNQDEIAKSIKYLIEKDIVENGLRNVGNEINNTLNYYNPHAEMQAEPRSIKETVNVKTSPSPVDETQKTKLENEGVEKVSKPDNFNSKQPVPTNSQSQKKNNAEFNLGELNIFGD